MFLHRQMITFQGDWYLAPVQNRGPLEDLWAQNVKFFGKEEIIESNNSLAVISLSKVGENEFLQTL